MVMCYLNDRYLRESRYSVQMSVREIYLYPAVFFFFFFYDFDTCPCRIPVHVEPVIHVYIHDQYINVLLKILSWYVLAWL